MKTQSFPRYENCPAEVRHLIDLQRFHSLVYLMEYCCEKYGSKTAFDCLGKSISYQELDRLSTQFAAYLQQHLELPTGTRVALQLPNLLQYPIALLGAFRAGMIVVNINPLCTPHEMKHQLVDSGAEVIVILANFADKLEQILPETALRHMIITEAGDQLGGLKKLLINSSARYVKKVVPRYRLPKAVRFNRALKWGGWHFFRRIPIKAQDTAFLQYKDRKSGMAGRIELCHAESVANAEQLFTRLAVKNGEEILMTK